MNDQKLAARIPSPSELSSMTDREIASLAADLRREMIETVAENGGHLASNLGMVEATLALHRVFELSGRERSDTLIFDVGHQCYAHKLLTGRADRFRTIRTGGGLSGFTNRLESPCDTVTCGHSGSSVSTAMGIAEADRLRYGIGSNAPWTVAVVGDGSFTNGMIFEALNSLSGRDLNLIVLLNDNEMSISKNVGGLSRYLSYIRTSEGYFTFKFFLKRFFSALPFFGGSLVRAARAVRDLLKRITNSETFFENLGLEYIGPVDGNDYRRMVNVLEEAKTKNAPVIVHMKTKKGLGYAPAEEHPERFHGASPFEPSTGQCRVSQNEGTTFTSVLSSTVCALAERDERICAITAAMTEGCGLTEFSHRFADRFFDVGIAEEHATALSSGLALRGMTPILVLYSTFAQRVFDQLWHDVRLQDVHVVVALSHCGLVPGDGVTHQGLYDVALFRSIPDITVYSPATADELRGSLVRAVSDKGLCIVRYPKGTAREWGVTFEEGRCRYPFMKLASFSATCGTRETGKRRLVVTYGRIAHDVAEALDRLSREGGWDSDMVVLERILPLPTEELRELIRDGGYCDVAVVEEGVRDGGLGEAIAAAIPCEVRIIAADDPLIPHGSLAYIKHVAALDVDSLIDRVGRQPEAARINRRS